MATHVSLQAQGLYCDLCPCTHKIQICIDKNEHCSDSLLGTGLQGLTMVQSTMWHTTLPADRLNREHSAGRGGTPGAFELG
eukprot:15365704-Ditylum_brightwellii.AAC.1